MSTVKEIQMVQNIISKQKNRKIALMNCTSEYPPILEDLNLGFIPIFTRKIP